MLYTMLVMRAHTEQAVIRVVNAKRVGPVVTVGASRSVVVAVVKTSLPVTVEAAKMGAG